MGLSTHHQKKEMHQPAELLSYDKQFCSPQNASTHHERSDELPCINAGLAASCRDSSVSVRMASTLPLMQSIRNAWSRDSIRDSPDVVRWACSAAKPVGDHFDDSHLQ